MKKQLVLLFVCALFSMQVQAQKKYALLIGVDYKRPVPKLTWTVRDAIEFSKILKKNFGYKVKVLTTSQETTLDRIKKEFSNLKKNSHKYNQIIVFFSGHGVQDEGSRDVGYLLPYDVNPNDYYSSAIDMSTFQNLSKTLKSKQALFILDCCYSGIIGSYHTMDATFSDRRKANISKNRRSRQILTAGLSDQKARIYPAQKLSVFTYFLIKALSYNEGYLGADSYGDGEVNLWNLQSYIRDKVSAYTNNSQTPGIYNYTNNDGIFLFKGKKTPVRKVAGSNFNANVSTDKSANSITDTNPKKVIVKVEEIRKKPSKYNDYKITVKGKIVQMLTIPFLGSSKLLIDDGTGKIWIAKSDNNYTLNEEIEATGILRVSLGMSKNYWDNFLLQAFSK